MESATCCGMELARSVVWNQPKGLDGIKPQARYMLARDEIQDQENVFFNTLSKILFFILYEKTAE